MVGPFPNISLMVAFARFSPKGIRLNSSHRRLFSFSYSGVNQVLRQKLLSISGDFSSGYSWQFEYVLLPIPSTRLKF